MLRCLTADTHCIGVVVEPILNFLQNGLVVCTENLIRVDDVMVSPKLAE